MFNDNKLRKKILLFAVIPSLLAGVSLIASFTALYNSQVQSLKREKFELVERIIAARPPAPLQGPELERLASILLTIKPLHSISVFDADRHLVIAKGLPGLEQSPLDERLFRPRTHQWHQGTTAYRMIPLEANDRANQGWVLVQMDGTGFSILQHRGFITLLLIAAALVAVTAYCATRLRGIMTKPLRQLEAGVAGYLAGNAMQAIAVEKDMGFQRLAEAIGELAKKQQLEQDSMRSGLDEYTQEQRDTPEAVETQNIELDMARENTLPSSRAKPPKTDRHQQPGDKPVRILAVDDNPANLRLVAELLRGLGTQAEMAHSGAAALEICAGSDYDLILMDVQMPEMDGFETTRRLRDREGAGNRTPIIALTAHAVDEQKARLLLAGMDDYVGKPVSEKELRHVIERWVSHLKPEAGEAPASSATRIEPKSLSRSGPEPGPESESESGSEPAIFDPAMALELAGHKTDLARDMFVMLLESLEDTATTMTEATRDEDMNRLQNIVHKLYGGCCYCGVPALRQASAELHSQLHRQQLSGINDTVASLLARIDELLQWTSERDMETLFAEVEES